MQSTQKNWRTWIYHTETVHRQRRFLCNKCQCACCRRKRFPICLKCPGTQSYREGSEQKATDNIQAEIDPDNIEASIKPFEADLGIAIDNCIKDKIISSGSVTIETENVNILVDETLNVSIEWVPMGTVRKFDLTFAVNNPYGAGAE